MTNDELTMALGAARDCAHVMLSNAAYIQRELPGLELSAALRAPVESICSRLVGTKHDILTELHELQGTAGGCENPSEIVQIVTKILQWIQQDISELHEVVIALEKASEHDQGVTLAYLLVAESAVNIIEASGRLHEALPKEKNREPPGSSES